MKVLTRWLIGAIAGTSIAFCAPKAEAYVTSGQWCNNTPPHWTQGYLGVNVATCSFPDGSLQRSALDSAVSKIYASTGTVAVVGTYSSCTISRGDGVNQIAIVAANNAFLDGAIGRTFVRIATPCGWTDGMIMEADVHLSVNLDFSVLNENTFSSVPGRSTIIHELTHGLGFGHVWTFNVNREFIPFPLVGGTGETADLMPDDIRGIRNVYGTYFAYENLFASPWGTSAYPQGDIVQLHPSGTIWVPRGGSITRQFTAGNQSTSNATNVNQYWYLRLNGTGPYILVAQNIGNSIQHTNYWQFQRTISIPANIATGDYRLVHWVANAGGGDSVYGDNATMSREVIHVY